jgi:hypothetical protein
MAQSKLEIKNRFELYESKMSEFIQDGRLNNEKSYSEWFSEILRNTPINNPTAAKVKEKLRVYVSELEVKDRRRNLELQTRRKALTDTIDS